MGLIQAKDIDQPDTLRNPHATCLIRMTEPSFQTFVTAFQDPESRIRLNSDVSEPNHSRLETIQITGGYLDGLSVEFADHLNTIIGGRGTGKSTLLECIRYVLGLRPIGKDAAKQHDQIISTNIGASKARIEVTVRSWKMNGKRFTISRKYPDDAYVRDEHGAISSFTPADILPTIDIFGQNEIFDIARDSNAQRQLLARFLDSGQECDTHREELLGALKKNRKKLIEATDQASTIEDDLARLPKLEEEISQYKSLGIEDTLRIIPLLEQEKRLRDRIEREELPAIRQVLDALGDAIPDTAFLTDHAIATLPHKETLRKIKSEFDRLAEILSTMHTTVSTSFTASQESIATSLKEIESGIRKEEMHLEEQFKELPSSAGKTGKEIGTAYQRLLIQIERIKPMQTSYENQKRVVNELKKQRESLLADLAECRASHSAQVERSLK